MAGLFRAAGGFRKREREELSRLPGRRCRLHPERLAVALIVSALGELSPACGDCAAQGSRYGYRVVDGTGER